MFTLTITNEKTLIEMSFADYTSAIGTFFSILGNSIIQREDKAFVLTLNDTVIREVEINNGKVIFDNSIVEI